MVLIDVLLGRYKGQFRDLETRLITRSSMSIPYSSLTPLHLFPQLPILIHPLVAYLLETVHSLQLAAVKTIHFIINCY